MLRIYIVLIVGLILFSCTKQPKVYDIAVSYTIDFDSGPKKDIFENRVISVLVDSTVTVSDISLITDSISTALEDKDILINFQLPNSNTYPNGVFATSRRVNGDVFSTVYAEPKINREGLKTVAMGNCTYDNSHIIIYEKDNKYYLYTCYPPERESLEDMEVVIKNGIKAFRLVDDEAEYYIIKNDGIHIYDIDGNDRILCKKF